ncbi:hypothetical protein Sgou_52680 [Streptomyces gougerotii]|uniref:Uncharacterized protein n=1 Tax=Streptomyces gougerotii TaxID=53448 RepID=A0A6A0CR34_9ACTN|nr:hypothetical protein EES47_05650 [Streptomyces sp. ADI98-12]GFH65365.1 hypothetical protein Srut_18790 [Streptomyces rutgersensis]GFH79842.1 hypothetical protein Sgou_45120 [Streptomyces gougerotii]GFH80598.1 hypothetical protein Sgou_52680 [Streptomyces gougerotii]GGU63023.1 hypothetical protein GCM10010227_15600 [Streptomyces gougerotii]
MSSGSTTAEVRAPAEREAPGRRPAIPTQPAPPADARAETADGCATLTASLAGHRVTADSAGGHRALGLPDGPKGAVALDVRTGDRAGCLCRRSATRARRCGSGTS